MRNAIGDGALLTGLRRRTASVLAFGAVAAGRQAAAQTSDAAGGTVPVWLLIAGAAVLAAGYILLLRWLRRRAATQTGDREAPRSTFSAVELDRYSRHILLREIGGDGQRKLGNARVAVIGAGGLGSPALLYLAGAGIGRLTVIDDDRVELSNLQRQIIHTDQRIGNLKAESAAAAMRALNPHIEAVAVCRRVEPAAHALLDEHDVVLDGSDSFETRSLVNALCAEKAIPLVSGAISQWEGQVTVADPGHGHPCLTCLFPTEPSAEAAPSCAEAGVMAVLPGIIGTLMAAEAVKLITGAGQILRGKMLIYDALWGETRTVTYSRSADCPVCGVDSQS